MNTLETDRMIEQIHGNENLVERVDACPFCGERQADNLAWNPPHQETVHCYTCDANYTPA